MSNPLKLLYKNLARVTGVSASSVASGYSASALLAADKDTAFRATGSTVTLSGSSATLLTASGLILAHCNLSPTATAQLVLWSDQAGTELVLDTGAKPCCPAPAIELEGWTPAQAASAYAYGGGANAALWFAETGFRKWALTITDTDNLQGYIEACYLMLGPTWSPEYDIEIGATYKLCNTDTQVRTAASSLKSRAGVKYREIPLDLSLLTAPDRQVVKRMVRASGRTSPIGIALYPDDSDAELSRDTLMVGKITEETEFTLNGPDAFATRLNFGEI